MCICGFTGYGNAGDEGILLAMLDSLGKNKFIICTSLPSAMLGDYEGRFPKDTVEVRQIYDVRSDYDAFILGGGALGWGFGWHQALTAFSSDKPSMYYGVGLNWHERYTPKMNKLYGAFIDRFDAVTVRDQPSKLLAERMSGQDIVLTSCPSINLKEEPFDCPKNMIAVCPRYEDWVSNDGQLDWLTNRLLHISNEVLLIAFAPFNTEGVPVDYSLCLELKKHLKGSRILNLSDASNPRRIKYAISQSKLVVSGGRYHAIVWASAHGVPFEVSPTCVNYPKIGAFQKMHTEYGGEKLKLMEKKNKEIFMEKCLK